MSPPRVCRSIFLGAIAGLTVSACGSGTAAIVAGGGGGGGDKNAPTVVSDLVVGATPTDHKTSPVRLSFKLTDAESDVVAVTIGYELPGAGAVVPMLLKGSPSLSALSSGPSGRLRPNGCGIEANLRCGYCSP